MMDLIEAVPGLLEQLFPQSWDREPLVFAAWRKTAGEPLKRRTRPLRFNDGCLTIAVEDRIWKRHLEDLSGDILYRLNAILGQRSVTYLEFKVDKKDLEHDYTKKQTTPTGRESFVDHQHPAAKASEAIADERLRESFLDFAGVCLQKAAAEAKIDRT